MIGVYVVVGTIFALMIAGAIYRPFWDKKWRDYHDAVDTFYPVDEPDKDVPMERKIGKLVRKVIDKPPTWRNGRLYGARGGIDPIFKKKDFFWKYYLTFETFDGYKSFTVSKADYHKYRTKSYGYIYFQDTLFSHFEIRNREDLNIDELIKQHQQKR